MRLHIGDPPPTPNFHPAEEGWNALREPSPLVLQLVAVPLGFLAAFVLLLGWDAEDLKFEFNPSTDSPTAALVALLAVVVGFFALVAVHELIHALGYPRFGFDRSTIIAVWPAKLLFYAVTHHALSRNRLLLVYLLPLIVLSVLPLVACRLLNVAPGWVMLPSLVNAVASGGDVFCFFLILLQVPRTALVRNQGWATWWRVASEPS